MASLIRQAGEVLETTDKAGVPAAIDALGGQTGADAARPLGRYGVMFSYGLLSSEPIPIDGLQMIFRCSTVRGFWLRDWFRSVPVERQHTVSAELLRLMARGKIAPPIEAEYPLKEVVKAVQHAERTAAKASSFAPFAGFTSGHSPF
jgi:NADPH:quinone reductase-like Zn-dependent oxidoreductase